MKKENKTLVEAMKKLQIENKDLSTRLDLTKNDANKINELIVNIKTNIDKGVLINEVKTTS